jgi:hypothetical protein
VKKLLLLLVLGAVFVGCETPYMYDVHGNKVYNPGRAAIADDFIK